MDHNLVQMVKIRTCFPMGKEVFSRISYQLLYVKKPSFPKNSLEEVEAGYDTLNRQKIINLIIQ